MVPWQEKAIFLDFKEMMLRNSQNPTFAVEKSFFQNSTRLHFCVADYVLRVSYVRDTYEKCLLESKQTFDIFWSIMRHVQVAPWQEKAIFVNFKKMILRSSQNPILAVQKSFFQILTRLRFWLVDYVLRISYARYTYKKCLLESKQTFDIFWNIMRYVKVALWQEKAIFSILRK